MTTALDGVQWKLARAREHHETLYGAAEALAEHDFYGLATEQDRKGRLVFRAINVRPIPPGWGVLIGDCVHNLRSALDHLMFAICHPTPEQEHTVQFPIFSRRDSKGGRGGFRDARGMTPGAPRGVRTVLESLQPYHRRKWPEAIRLAQLRELANWDKHRLLLTAAASIVDSSIRFQAEGTTSIVREVFFKGLLKEGTVLARLEMGYSEVGAKVDVDPASQISLLPVFDDGMPKVVRREPVLSTLSEIGMFVQDEVVPRFERFL